MSEPLPSWEILNIVTSYLDPRTVALASCVCKSWDVAMSSDVLWSRMLASDFPLLSEAFEVIGVDPLVRFRRLYGNCYTSQERPRLHVKPYIVFFISVTFGTVSIDVVKLGEEMVHNPDGKTFMFGVDVAGRGDLPFEFGATKKAKVTWTLVLKGGKGMFTLIDFEGKVSFSPSALEDGFLVLLPEACPWCDVFKDSMDDPRMMAELMLTYSARNNGRIGIDKLVVRLLRFSNASNIPEDVGLRYLQAFLGK